MPAHDTVKAQPKAPSATDAAGGTKAELSGGEVQSPAGGPVPRAAGALGADPRLQNRPGNAQSIRMLHALQRTGGNAQVAAMVAQLKARERAALPVQRQAGTACPAPPQEPVATPPEQDPKFKGVTGQVKKDATALKRHDPPQKKAAEAQAAAKPPPDDVESQAKAAKTDTMATAKPGTFDKAAFVAAVRKAIAAKAPKNLDEADKFAKSGNASVKADVMGQVTEGKEGAAKDVKQKAEEPPDPSKAKPKEVKPAVEEKPGPKPADPGGAKAMPSPAPPAEKDLRAAKCETDSQMKDADVTEEQLAKSNEPEFTGALEAKKEGEQHSATAPADVEQKEKAVLGGAKQGADAEAKAAVTTMFGAKAGATSKVGTGKAATQSKDEQERAKVSKEIKAIYDRTEKDVKAILDGLDKKVDDAFSRGEAEAKSAFTAKHEAEMEAYKERRYSGFAGAARWVKDKFAGLPEEANQIYVRARDTVYLPKMDQVISNVADIVGRELNAAKQRIEQGRAEIKKYVAGLPANLKKFGTEAQKEFASKFDELEKSVDEKQNELVESLATKYTEARDAVDAEIKKMQEDNKGLWDKAKDAIGGVIKTILELKSMLMGALGRAAGVVGKIIKAPIEFLGNLVSGIKNGLQAFLGNIGEHLKKGVVGWLLGSLQSAGLELPSKFDLKGILKMIASLLGLTWGAIRGRVVKRGVPEQAMGAVEKAVPEVETLQKEGVPGLWQKIVAKIGDVKDMILTKLKEYLVPTVLTAGIMWIVSLLNPASAFVKAVKAIIDIVRFVFERAAQLFEFVNAVLDAVVAIAGGAVGGAAKFIENALAKSIPVLIGFLAALLGIGGLANKVKQIFQSLSKPVMKVVDKVVDTIVKFGKKLWAKLKGKGKKGKKDKKDKKKSQNIEREVKQALSGRLRGTIDGPEPVKSAIDSVYGSYRAKGLKKIYLRRKGADRFDVLVVASPATVATTVKFRGTSKFSKKDFEARVAKVIGKEGKETEKRRGISHTALVGTWNGEALPRRESKSVGGDVHANHHAEAVLITYIKTHYKPAQPPSEGQRNRLDITISKSPCSKCGEKLRAFASSHPIDLTLNLLGLHTKAGTDKAAAEKESIDVLIQLRAEGVKLRVPTLAEVMANYGGPELDPESIRLLNGRLEKLRPIVDKINKDAEEIEKAKAGV